MNRINETTKLIAGQKVTYGEFPATVLHLYDDGPCEGGRMYEVRVPGGEICVCGSDLIPTIVKFEVGKTYTCRSACDYNCIFSFEITRRSTKTVTIKYQTREVRRTIRVCDGAEQIDPHGRYSMSPILTARSN